MEDVEGVTGPILTEFFLRINHCGFSDHDLKLIKQSHDAFLSTDDDEQQRLKNAINGDIITDSVGGQLGTCVRFRLLHWLRHEVVVHHI